MFYKAHFAFGALQLFQHVCFPVMKNKMEKVPFTQTQYFIRPELKRCILHLDFFHLVKTEV